MKPKDSTGQALRELADSHVATVKACEAFVNRELAGTLRRRKLKQVRLDRALFTRIGDGVVAHGPIRLEDNVTKERLRKRSYPVGVLVNTVPLIDPVTGSGLAPGAALVELRPVLDGGYAFDFLGDNAGVRFSTAASITERERFDSIPVDRRLSAGRLRLLDADILDGSDPDDPVPPGSGIIVICVSFLHWIKCWVIYTGPTFPPPPILV